MLRFFAIQKILQHPLLILLDGKPVAAHDPFQEHAGVVDDFFADLEADGRAVAQAVAGDQRGRLDEAAQDTVDRFPGHALG
jgi:hypothetical protein